MRRTTAARATAILVLPGLLAACTGDSEPRPEAAPSAPRPSAAKVSAPETDQRLEAEDPALDVAVNEPVEDRVYPEVGDPGVDALHYQLDLAWTPGTETLDGVETLIFRATEDAEQFQLDFGNALSVSAVEVDGRKADHVEDGKDLVVEHPVTSDDRYTVRIRYSGSPRPAAAPTTRGDFNTVGWHVTESGETWTMQEPYGAYSWYAVNDHPSDKALYDFTISTPAPWVGVANGVLESREEVDGNTVTTWHLDEPAASYVVTAAVGHFRFARDRSDSGVPMTYWTPRGDVAARRAVRAAGRELDWVEERLGPYPFSSLGVVVVDSESGMETQTMITLGDTDYTLSPEVMVHEIVHQWWGNQVAPRDWRDVWMNEGMTMYLQAIWESEHYSVPLGSILREWAAFDQEARNQAGPPAAYDPVAFGEGNIYYLPALMWDQLRREIGDRMFWRLVGEWPQENDNGHGSYEEITDWWSERTGRDLTAFFDAWLLGEQSPPYDG
jgi:aminopeptidase N